MDLLNSNGRALTWIANHPRCSIREMANGMFLTRRTVWGMVVKLHRAHLIQVTKEGRLHRYEVGDLLLRQTLFSMVKYERLLA